MFSAPRTTVLSHSHLRMRQFVLCTRWSMKASGGTAPLILDLGSSGKLHASAALRLGHEPQQEGRVGPRTCLDIQKKIKFLALLVDQPPDLPSLSLFPVLTTQSRLLQNPYSRPKMPHPLLPSPSSPLSYILSRQNVKFRDWR